MKKFRIGFDSGGLLLFLAVMLPNFIWFAIPSPNDVLRRESVTVTLDTAASVFQGLMAAALIFVIHPGRKPLRLAELLGVIGCAVLYYSGWILYYLGWAGWFVILLLTVPPCLALLLYAAYRRNTSALILGIGFTCCHLVYAVANFMI